MTVMLLCGAGLLVRTVIALNGANNGFDKHDLLTMEIGVAGALDTRRSAGRVFYREAVAALRALPGVESAAAANSLPVIGTPRGGTVFHRLGTPELPMNERPLTTDPRRHAGIFPHASEFRCCADASSRMADDANPEPGFVVNEAFAKAYLDRLDPLGASLTVWMEHENPYLPVIGVVGNVSEGSVRDNAQPTVFYSHRRMDGNRR